jgi:hypothetical protein
MKLPLLLVGMLLAPPTAFSGGPEAAPPPFSVHDHDRNGYLDRREYGGIRQRRLQRLDTGHGRGWLRHRELLDFDAIDRNGDERLSVEELGEALGSGRRLRKRLRQERDCLREQW